MGRLQGLAALVTGGQEGSAAQQLDALPHTFSHSPSVLPAAGEHDSHCIRATKTR